MIIKRFWRKICVIPMLNLAIKYKYANFVTKSSKKKMCPHGRRYCGQACVMDIPEGRLTGLRHGKVKNSILHIK
ncbi:MAG: hypothetical protein A2X01_17900 [Bacteroidetes bacterium GWF2_35_48]|nr:MAG: hypothetical protein A2X01_17900 [Bacteroidetes bacterium GWF2_35_48]